MIVPYVLILIVFISLFFLLINIRNEHKENLLESISYDVINYQINGDVLDVFYTKAEEGLFE